MTPDPRATSALYAMTAIWGLPARSQTEVLPRGTAALPPSATDESKDAESGACDRCNSTHDEPLCDDEMAAVTAMQVAVIASRYAVPATPPAEGKGATT